jgi:uncharacterized SAM-binding protein YcdF (DUF218 family)
VSHSVFAKASSIIANVMSIPLRVSAVELHRRDAVIVMGAPLRADGQLGAALLERVTVAAQLWKQFPSSVIIVTGGVTRTGCPSEASEMARELRKLGVNEASIAVEELAKNTFENAEFSARIMQARRVHTAWVVTQPFHLRRAVYYCREAGIDAQGFRIVDGVQDATPWLATKWSAREYAAWSALWLRRLARR